MFPNSAAKICPTGLKVVNVQKESAEFVWDPLPKAQPFGDLTGYAVFIREHSSVGQYNSTTVLKLQRTNFQIKQLLPASKYFVQVAAVNPAGIGSFSKSVPFVTQGRKLINSQLINLRNGFHH